MVVSRRFEFGTASRTATSRFTSMHDETVADLARILSFAATYMEENGRARFSFGGRPGGRLCAAAAIALALGCNPRRLGRGWFFLPTSDVHRAVGTVILRTDLLSGLPVPQPPHCRRKLRPAKLSPYRAVKELARWSDDKTLDSLVVGALRDRAYELDRVESLAADSKNNRAANSGPGANSHESGRWSQALITVGGGEKDG